VDRPDVGSSYYPDQLIGILKALRADIEEGYPTTFEEDMHADVFSDFLSMGDSLVADNFVLLAVIVAGAALESHLSALVDRNGVRLAGRGKHKRATPLNDDLAKQGVYRTAEQSRCLRGKAYATAPHLATASSARRRFV
jgi:hypothetical protein